MLKLSDKDNNIRITSTVIAVNKSRLRKRTQTSSHFSKKNFVHLHRLIFREMHESTAKVQHINIRNKELE